MWILIQWWSSLIQPIQDADIFNLHHRQLYKKLYCKINQSNLIVETKTNKFTTQTSLKSIEILSNCARKERIFSKLAQKRSFIIPVKATCYCSSRNMQNIKKYLNILIKKTSNTFRGRKYDSSEIKLLIESCESSLKHDFSP